MEPQASTQGPLETLRLVLADDHLAMRRGLALLLDAEPDLEVVAQASDINSTLRCVRTHHPSVLLLDLNMPGGSSLEAIPRLRTESPETEIVVLTMEAQPDAANAALRAGARGYVLKDAAEAELIEAIRSAAAGRTYINRQLAGRAVVAGILSGRWD